MKLLHQLSVEDLDAANKGYAYVSENRPHQC